MVGMLDLSERDALFAEDDFREAIDTYYCMLNTGCLNISKGAMGSDPASQIEPDGYRDNGASIYRISPNISNSQIAVLATAWYTKKSKAINQSIDFSNQLFKIAMGDIITI